MALFLLASLATLASGQTGIYSNSLVGQYTVTQPTANTIELILKQFPWPELPEHADTGNGVRGHMVGYNICNSTTEGPTSLCMTGWLNSLDDFCLWGAQEPDSQVGIVEAAMVAYCTLPGKGTRLIPPGALQGVQFMRTPDYVEVVGFIDQTALNIAPHNLGGEEDPHGADGRGNPLGALMYSTAFNETNPGDFEGVTQIRQWSYFIGENVFCFKVCDPHGPADNAANLCQHIYDTEGCTFNDPASYDQINGTFQACDGDDQTPAGEFVSAGITTTFVQGGSVPPYVASIPPSSNCAFYQSAELYTGQPVAADPQPNGTAAATTGAPGVGSSGDSGSGGATPAATGSASSAQVTGVGSSQDGTSAARRTADVGIGRVGWTIAAGLSAAVCGVALL